MRYLQDGICVMVLMEHQTYKIDLSLVLVLVMVLTPLVVVQTQL